MTSSRTDLSAFASGLAARLPGTWTSDYQCHSPGTDPFSRIEQLWAAGNVDHAVRQCALTHDAVLHGPDQQQLYVADRPRYPRQFLVAPLAPAGTRIKPHHVAAVAEPDGIAVPQDPARAAARIVRRLLPCYQRTLQAVLTAAETQPDPPHRPGPPPVEQVLTLTLYSDGALGAPYDSVPADARPTLYAHGFQYLPRQAAFLLPAAYGDKSRALRVQRVAQHLTASGIGVNLRHAAPTTSTALPPAGPPTPRGHTTTAVTMHH